MSEVFALLFGAVVIAVFARERFNIATYETQAALQRLGDLLTPNQMRARSTVRLSFLLYLVLVLTAYLAVCLYARMLPENFRALFGDPGAQLGAVGLPGAPAEAATSTLLPLSVALVFVGIGPSVPVIRHAEEWLRNLTHKLVGIPTHALENAETLRQRDAGGRSLEGIEDDPRIALRDEDRQILHDMARRPEATEYEDLLPSLRLIAAISAWIFGNRVSLRNGNERRRMEALEARLRTRKEKLFNNLRGKLKDPQAGSAAAHDTDAAPHPAGQHWSGLADETGRLADDIRIYLALLVEHRVLPKEQSGAGRNLSADALDGYLKEIRDFDDGLMAEQIVMVTLRRSFWIILSVGILWGALPAGIEQKLIYPDLPDLWVNSARARATSMSLTLVLAYYVPLFVAMSIWFARTELRTRRIDGRPQLRKLHWSEHLSQILAVVVIGWLVSCAALSTLAILEGILKSGTYLQHNNIIDRWLILMGYNAPISLRGAIFAGFLTSVIDRFYWTSLHDRAGLLRTASPIRNALYAAAVMALAGALTRTFMIWNIVSRSSPPDNVFKATDRGVIVYTSVQSALLGAIIVYLVLSVLIHHVRQLEAADGRQASPDSMEAAT